MCFFYALSVTAQRLENRYQLKEGFDWELGGGHATAQVLCLRL